MTTATTIKITFDEAVELLDRAVAEKGEDYIYPRSAGEAECLYVEDGQPSCIVGHVLFWKGLTLERIESIEGMSAFALNDYDWLDLDEKAEALLWKTQSRQDSGVPWGRAVAEAKAETASAFG
jgi:hypothetical protein